VRALRLHDSGDLRLHDEVDPAPDDNELLIRVATVGLCGSDRHWFCEGGIGDAKLAEPLVLGHEFFGVVARGPREGQRVALDPAIPCGLCETCLSGFSHLCLDSKFAGHSVDGALRTFVAWPEDLAFVVPDSVGDLEAALLEPLGVSLHAFDLGHAGPGTTAAVFGCGPLGLLLIQVLQAGGASVEVATDRLEHRLEAAERLGAKRIVVSGDVDRSASVDVSFEMSGEDEALEQAIAATRPGGRIVLVGIPDVDRTSFTASLARRKGLTFLACRRMKATDLSRAIDLAARRAVELSPLVTARYTLDEWPEAFDHLVHRRGLKVVIEL
jgi:L-iditol 2-dehydrogenase